jgi:hypothetical protein
MGQAIPARRSKIALILTRLGGLMLWMSAKPDARGKTETGDGQSTPAVGRPSCRHVLPDIANGLIPEAATQRLI